MGKKTAMAKQERGLPPTATVKLDRALVGRARLVAGDKGLDLSAYLGESLKATVDKDWAELVRKAGTEG